MTEITANEINLYNILVDEKGSEADQLIAQKISTEYAANLKTAAEADLAKFLSEH